MGRIITILFLLFSFISFSQTYTMRDSRSGDTVQRIIQTTKTDGIVKYLLITSTDTAEIRWDGTKLLINGYNLADSTDLTTDSIQELRSDMNKKVDSTNIRLYNTGNSVFIGEDAGLNDDLSSNYNVLIGYNAGVNNTGSNSNGFGAFALENNTGNYSNGFGEEALGENTGDYSNGFGYNALASNTGEFSNGFGTAALRDNTGINSNGFGANALASNTGANNTAVGHNASISDPFAYTNTTALGYNVQPSASNQVMLGDANITNVWMGQNGEAIIHSKNTGYTITYDSVSSDSTLTTLTANLVISQIEAITDANWNSGQITYIRSGTTILANPNFNTPSSYRAQYVGTEQPIAGAAITVTNTNWGAGTIKIILTIKNVE